MPGRYESWTEYVRFLGNDRWEYLFCASDFQGESTDTESEEYSTAELIDHVFVLEMWDRKGSSYEERCEALGTRMDALEEIFLKPGSEEYANMLEAQYKPWRDVREDEKEIRNDSSARESSNHITPVPRLRNFRYISRPQVFSGV